MLLKSQGKHPYLVTMEYNSSPKQTLPSPAEMLMGRKFRTQLPCSRKALKPHFNTERHIDILHDNQTKSAAYYNIGRKPLPLLSKQSVVIQPARSKQPRQTNEPQQ
ncbi:hypothetical protein QE152_g19039 [Popillia japonica]|uniref:Uncharacterized protein n=1 Tax=Popillia japonica TaxID=7064 RepID=A0AAW1L374_POPJA